MIPRSGTQFEKNVFFQRFFKTFFEEKLGTKLEKFETKLEKLEAKFEKLETKLEKLETKLEAKLDRKP